MICYHEESNRLRVIFQYNPDSVTFVKSIPGRQWHSDGKFWSVPNTEDNLKLLKTKFLCHPQLDVKLEIADSGFGETEAPMVKKKLFPFQKQGLTFLNKRNGRALLGDEMGLGKTIQTLAWLSLHHEARPALVICPNTLKPNWAKETYEAVGLSTEIIYGTKNKTPEVIPSEIYIINYDIIGKNLEYIKKLKVKTIILDECHYIKNKKANRTKVVVELCKSVPYLIAISGTPIINRPSEFFTVLNLLDKANFSSFWKFAERYCGLTRTRFGWIYNGATNTKELYERLNGKLMLRRLKKDVLKELPDKMREVIPLDIDNRKEYELCSNDFSSWLGTDYGSAEAIVQMEKLKQLAVKGKMNQILDWIEDFLSSGKKLVLFATHIETLNILQDEFPDCSVRIDGSTPQEKRMSIVEEFNSSSTKNLFLGNIKASGVGITLTGASDVAFVELGWTPGEHIQAEDRIHRIGQKECCQIHYLIAKDTIEEELAKLIQKKLQVLNEILDGKSSDKEEQIYSLLIEKLKKKSV